MWVESFYIFMNLMNNLHCNVVIEVFDALQKENYELAEKKLNNKFNSTVLQKEVSKTKLSQKF